MPRANIYLPAELAASASRLEINLSALVQEQLRQRLRVEQLSIWLGDLAGLPPTGVSHEQALAELD